MQSIGTRYEGGDCVKCVKGCFNDVSDDKNAEFREVGYVCGECIIQELKNKNQEYMERIKILSLRPRTKQEERILAMQRG